MSNVHTPKAGADCAGAPNAEEEAKLPNPCSLYQYCSFRDSDVETGLHLHLQVELEQSELNRLERKTYRAEHAPSPAR
jgi:hypothetical protein